MNSKFLSGLAAFSLMGGMLAGCSSTTSDTTEVVETSSDAETTTNDTTDTTSSDDVVKIGLNFELSGAVADYGTAERKGALTAIEMFNQKEDKPFTVEAVEIDNKSDAAESTSAATRLITQDHVAGIVGPATSGASIATYAVASENGVPVISPSATQVDAMLNSGDPYEYAWRVCFEDSYQGKAMANYVYDTLDAKRVVVFNEVSDYGQGLADAFIAQFEADGGEVLDQIQYNSGDTDFSSYITRIKSMDPEAVYIAGYYNEAGKIIKQAKDDGLDVPFVGADGFDAATLVEQTGTDYANNIFYTTAYTAVNPSDELQAFIDAYKEQWDEEPSMFAALAYDATNLLIENLVESAENGTDLNEAIANSSFDGITGSFDFDTSTHTPNKSVLIVELVDGEQANATEVEAA